MADAEQARLAPATDEEKRLLREYVARDATEDERNAFLHASAAVISDRARNAFLDMSAKDQYRVIAAGPMTPCENSTEILYTRVKDFQEMERKVRSLAGTVEESQKKEKKVSDIALAVASQIANPKFDEVPASERRCAGAAFEHVAEEEGATCAALEGTCRGVGGVIEALLKKYSMQKGERVRVVGESKELWKVDGERTLPKTQCGVGWRWVIKGADAEAKKKAEEAARKKREKEEL
eukprot:TRINITY_DN11806_c0_g1_i2.p2 TRINITY_DN11806_c0_g1~~TRINITY_DN11806_c0_g1_i2.p2  ORF type:complete len:237 (-),score=80.60 TRINITY_DN11806_c0_g1_i2:1256-1966(-)